MADEERVSSVLYAMRDKAHARGISGPYRVVISRKRFNDLLAEYDGIMPVDWLQPITWEREFEFEVID